MTDERIRAAGRRAGAGDDAQDARWLLERVRVNTLDRARLVLAARCDHPAARLALPEVPVASIVQDLLWEAERVDPLVGVVAAVAIADAAAEAVPEPHHGAAREVVSKLEEFIRTRDGALAQALMRESDFAGVFRPLPGRRRRRATPAWIHAYQALASAASSAWDSCAPMRRASLAARKAQFAHDWAARANPALFPTLAPDALLGRIKDRLGAWAVE